MNDYTLSQIKSMQDDATRRVREMNERSKNTVEKSNNNINHNIPQTTREAPKSNMAHETHRMHETHEKEKEPHKSEPPSKSEPFSLGKKGSLSFLKSLDIKKLIGENSEQAMILLLILILLNDDSSEDFLIYALIYIML